MTLDRRTMATLALILAAILFLAFNLAVDTFLRSARIDLTENQIHTLSEGTRKTLANLDEPITLKFYYSEKTATGVANISAYAARVRDLLSEYTAQSNGKLHIEEVKPTPDSDEEDQATQDGLQERSIRGTDLKIFLGLVGTNTVGGKQTIPYFDEQRDQYLEYDLTSAISLLNARQKPKLGVITSLPLDTGSGGMAAAMQGQSQPLVVYQELQDTFEVEMLDQDIDRVPETISTLLIAHPKVLSSKTLYAIDQFVMRGGHVIAFVDPMSELSQMTSGMGGPNPEASFSSDLGPLFKAWGISYDPNIVIADRSLAPTVQYGNDSISYVLWLQLKEDQLNREDITTSELSLVNLGTPGFIKKADGATTTFVPLMQTSEDSEEVPSEQAKMTPQPEELLRTFLPTGQRYTIAARVSGAAVSAFPDGPPPEEPKPATPDDPSKPPEAPKTPLPTHIKEAQQPINIIVVADSDIFDDRFWVQVQEFMGQRVPVRVFGHNGPFVINAVQNMMGSNDLISLRTRERVERPFTRTAQMRKAAETRELAEIQQLQGKLDDTNRRLNELRGTGTGDQQKDESILTPEQNTEVQRLEGEAAQTRKTLRGVRRDLRSDIDSLGNVLAFVNIALMPLILVALSIALSYRRRMKRRTQLESAGA